MELLTSILAGLFAFIGSIVGNIMANDLCVSATAVCSKIIRSAARGIGVEPLQGRYEEEWLADLAERDTVYAKYHHAIGCYLVSGKIRRESRKIYIHILYFVPRYGKVLLKFNLSSRFLFPVWFWAMGTTRLRDTAMWLGFAYYVFRAAKVAHVDQPGRLPQLIDLANEAVKDKSIKDWPFNVKLSRNGASWNLTGIAHLILKNPNAILVLKSKLDANTPKEIAEALIEGKYKPKKDQEQG
jgi:hypothetical protein